MLPDIKQSRPIKEDRYIEPRQQEAFDSLREIPKAYRKKLWGKIEDEKEAVKTCATWAEAEDGERPKPWIYLYGKSGSGKTMLAALMSGKLIRQKSLRLTWLNCTELQMESRDAMKRNTPESTIVNKYSGSELLVMDDLGAGVLTGFALSGLYIILNRRSESEKRTIITSNLAPSDMAKSDVRITDRILRSATLVGMKNGSYALR